MSHVTFSQFNQLQIVIGTIVSVAEVPDADRLLKLMVDVGEDEPRQVISGIREYFAEPEVLVGVQCPFLINLEPRIIRGLESQAMILASHTDTTFSLLKPQFAMPTGTPVQ